MTSMGPYYGRNLLILQEVNAVSELNDVDFNSAMAAFESKHFGQACQLLGPFAHQGYVDAQHRLAIMYQNGLGVAANSELAVKWMRAAADQGYALAQHGLGFMYMEGECVEKNAAEAIKWFKLAAEQGLVGSQTTLAMMYEEGNGVAKDLAEAKKWYALAGF